MDEFVNIYLCKGAVVLKEISTRCKKTFFSHRIVDYWNRLPDYIVTAAITSSFKLDLILGRTDMGIKSLQHNKSNNCNCNCKFLLC